MIYKAIKKVEQCLIYKINQWKIKGTFEILNIISERVTLVQMVDMVGGVNHSVSIDGNWIFNSSD